MKPIAKMTAVVGLTAVMAASVATQPHARNRWVGPAVGFAAGAIVGGAIANANRPYYGCDPYYGCYPGSYVGPVYPDPNGPYRQCWVTTDDTRGYGYYRPC
jgi:hypothetical protein